MNDVDCGDDDGEGAVDILAKITYKITHTHTHSLAHSHTHNSQSRALKKKTSRVPNSLARSLELESDIPVFWFAFERIVYLLLLLRLLLVSRAARRQLLSLDRTQLHH